MSPILFNVYLEEMINEHLEGRGVNIGGRSIKCTRFADDMALLAEDEGDLQRIVTNLEEGCIKYGLKINVNKTKSLWLGQEKKRIQIKVKDEFIEQVNGFRYLGSWVSEDGRSESEIKRAGMAKRSI